MDERPKNPRPPAIRIAGDIDEGSGGGRMLTILLVSAAVIAGAYLLLGRDDRKDDVIPPAAASTATSEPLKCIEERCAPRPERLSCLRRDGTPSSCVEWQIIWEDRCQCLERGHQRDGGTP